MAAEAAIDSSQENKTTNLAGMKAKHKNGVILDKDIDISTYLEKQAHTNGHESLSTKLNGFYTHINSGKATASPVREGIRASSFRASPVRNKSMSVPTVDSSKSGVKGDNRLKGNTKPESLPCKWMDCHHTACDVPQLASHAQEQHVDPMKTCDIFVCLWQDCKVFNRPSCSMSWLTKHLESHIGVKPFKCIFEGCSLSFSTQTGLARHVPCHFQENVRQNKKNFNNNLGKDDSPSKRQLKRKRLKYIRYKKPGSHGKVEDFVDQHAVDSIKSRLESMVAKDQDTVGIDGSLIHFVGKPLGKRVNKKGEKEMLFRWIPESILPDEWLLDDDIKTPPRRCVPIHCLPNDVKAELHPSFYRRLSHRKKRRK
ncbi:zinc finger AEBP2-like [Paramuricea clavata]|uniref:Zinc finger AEBP2-like n=1 Tax=Paramuricea clavata TaxID=317549 RepID=A0A7D9EQ62_PARCT|nr:zinc finger AEBP2-like [Paramuricea clavata]